MAKIARRNAITASPEPTLIASSQRLRWLLLSNVRSRDRVVIKVSSQRCDKTTTPYQNHLLPNEIGISVHAYCRRWGVPLSWDLFPVGREIWRVRMGMIGV